METGINNMGKPMLIKDFAVKYLYIQAVSGCVSSCALPVRCCEYSDENMKTNTEMCQWSCTVPTQ